MGSASPNSGPSTDPLRTCHGLTPTRRASSRRWRVVSAAGGEPVTSVGMHTDPPPGPAPPARGFTRRLWRGPRPGLGRGAGGAGPGVALREGHRSRGAASGARHGGCGEPGRAAPPPEALAGLGRGCLRGTPASRSARHSELSGRCSRRRQPGAAGRSRRAIRDPRSPPPSCARQAGVTARGPAGGRAGGLWGPGSGLAPPPPRALSAGLAQQLQ